MQVMRQQRIELGGNEILALDRHRLAVVPAVCPLRMAVAEPEHHEGRADIEGDTRFTRRIVERERGARGIARALAPLDRIIGGIIMMFVVSAAAFGAPGRATVPEAAMRVVDRKSTRLNSSHVKIS